MTIETKNKLKTLGYLAKTILLIPVAVAAVITTALIPMGIQRACEIEMFLCVAIALVPVFAIAKAFFEWMFRIEYQPAHSFLHAIGAMCVATEFYLLILFSFCGDNLEENTAVLVALTIGFLVVFVSVTGCSMKLYIADSRRLFKEKEDERKGITKQREAERAALQKRMEAEREAREQKRKEVLERFEAGELSAGEVCEMIGHEWGLSECITTPRQCCFGPSDCTLCGGCITGSGTASYPGSYEGANLITYTRTQCERCGAVEYH